MKKLTCVTFVTLLTILLLATSAAALTSVDSPQLHRTPPIFHFALAQPASLAIPDTTITHDEPEPAEASPEPESNMSESLPPELGTLIREPDAIEPIFDRLTITDLNDKYEYALSGPDGVIISLDDADWQSGSSSQLQYTQLDPFAEYYLLIREWSIFEENAKIYLSVIISILDDVVMPDTVDGSVEQSGYGCITVKNSVAGRQYAVTAANGIVAALAQGNGGDLFISGLLPGARYFVSSPGDELQPDDFYGHSTEDGSVIVRGTPVTLPVVGDGLALLCGYDENNY